MEVYNKQDFEKLKNKQKEEYLQIGKITKKHGIKGDYRIKIYSEESYDILEKYKKIYVYIENKGYIKVKFEETRIYKK